MGQASTLGPGEQAALIDAAGIAAVHRAQRPDAEGFVTNRTKYQLGCVHEAAHAVVATAVGKVAHWVMVAWSLDGAIRGLTYITSSPEEGSIPEPFVEGDFKSDRENLSLFCEVMNGGDWDSCIANLEGRLEPILERHWRAIKLLAGELEREGVVRRPAIESIFGSHGAGPASEFLLTEGSAVRSSSGAGPFGREV